MEKKKLPLKKKLLFSIMPLLFIFFAGEVGMRIYHVAKGKIMPAPHKALAKEWTWAKAHLEADVAEFKNIHMFDPHVGWRLRPNLKTADVISNSAGMRNEREFSKHSTGKRILFVGDSYTYGSFVKNDEIYTYFLQNSLPDWEILNMAVGGTGTDQQLVTYEVYGKEYNPQIVVLGFFVWDFFRNFLSFRSYLKPYFTIEDQKVVLRKDHIIPPQQLFDEYKKGTRSIPTWSQSFLINKLSYTINQYMTRNLHDHNKGFIILSYMMERFQQQVRETGAEPIWLIIPNRDVVKDNYRYHKIIRFCTTKCEELKMRYVRLDKEVVAYSEQNPEKQIYRPRNIGGHFSATGHKLTARVLQKYLEENQLLKTK